jgi:thiamine-phosphate pyrophosphorylase
VKRRFRCSTPSSKSIRARPIQEKCRLYLITPPDLGDVETFRDTLAAALGGGEVACVQLRLKDVDDDAIRRACEVLRPVAQDRDVAFILNDRPDLARETGCDGVHVGQEDVSYAEARAVLGDDAIVGVTCHSSYHLAMEASEAGADYVAFGAFFPSTTKDAKGGADPEILTVWQRAMLVPCVAIGGIKVENCAPLVTAGADFLAVASGVWDAADGPAKAVADYNAAIAGAPPFDADIPMA